MKTLSSTSEIVSEVEYIPLKDAFLKNFSLAFGATRCQILKLETLQFYNEQGNPSFDAFIAGDLSTSIEKIRASKADEAEAYQHLSEGCIEFLRVRSVVRPLSDYLKWELLNYNQNQAMGERIFLWNSLSSGDFFDKHARHDFMVFDARFAMVYDYDDEGVLKGGWFLDDTEKIAELIAIFGFAKANSSNFQSIYPNGFSLES
jgi:hypothetical protein